MGVDGTLKFNNYGPIIIFRISVHYVQNPTNHF